MNVLQKSIEAFIASQGKTAAAGLKLRCDLQDVYLPENGVGEILRDIYGEDATRRTHETQYNAIHYAWVTIGDDGKRQGRQQGRQGQGRRHGWRETGATRQAAGQRAGRVDSGDLLTRRDADAESGIVTPAGTTNPYGKP